MLFLKNIQSVSKYESKLLYRSWFFKVFATLTVIATIFTAIATLNESRHVESIPTLLGYSLMLTFNIGQAIVSIFLASEYLKRDKQLDTSEIFYVRPLSNAEYLLGKMWGTIRVFLLLNLIVIHQAGHGSRCRQLLQILLSDKSAYAHIHHRPLDTVDVDY